MASAGLVKYLGGPGNELPLNIRVTPDGKMVSVIDIIMVVSFTNDDGRVTQHARTGAQTYYERLLSGHPEAGTLCTRFKFKGRGQQMTPVATRKGIFQIIQLLRGKRAAKFREASAALIERYLDADMGLADDITDRALTAHMAELHAHKTPGNTSADGPTEPHKRIESRDTTKIMCQAVKEKGAHPRYYGLMNGGVNHAITGMMTKAYRDVQVNLRPKEAAREAFTDSMLHMTGTINCLVRDNLQEGQSMDQQLEFMGSKCSQAAELLGLHARAKQVQPRDYIVGNKRIMAEALAADKRMRLLAGSAVPAIA